MRHRQLLVGSALRADELLNTLGAAYLLQRGEHFTEGKR